MRELLNSKAVVCIVYVAAMFMAAMDATIVNVALKTIGGDLGATSSAASAVNVGYLVSLAVVLPAAGWLGDRWGAKRMFVLALALFTIASVLCGAARSLETLTLFRVLQGAGGGLLTPTGMAMLLRAFPPEERVKISRTLVLPIALAPALGPIVGGWFTEEISWRWAFYINVPIGIVALALGMLFLREHDRTAAGRLDLPGILLAASGFPLALFALSQGAERGWSSPEIALTGLGGAALLAALIWVELRTQRPMLDLRLLRDRLFRTMGLISMFSAAGLLGMLYVFPLMVQDVLGASALEAGLMTFPEALGLMLASRLVPWSYRRLGPRRLAAAALLCAALVFTLLSMTGAESSPWQLRLLLFGAGLFLGHAVGVVQAAAFANVQPPSMGRASALFTVQNRLGSALGLAVLASMLAALGSGAGEASAGMPNLAAYRAALLAAAVFLLAAAGFALRIRDADASATLHQAPKGAPSGKPAAG